MLLQVMNEINNHFIKSYPEFKAFEIVTDGIVGDFRETYLPGMYILIEGSYLNDGLYKITDVTSSKLTVGDTLQAEDTDDSFIIIGCTPPKVFLDLVNEIKNFSQSVGANSESIDDYSISYGKDGSWESAFSTKLSKYRKVFNDIESVMSDYPRWQERDMYGY